MYIKVREADGAAVEQMCAASALDKKMTKTATRNLVACKLQLAATEMQLAEISDEKQRVVAEHNQLLEITDKITKRYAKYAMLADANRAALKQERAARAVERKTSERDARELASYKTKLAASGLQLARTFDGEGAHRVAPAKQSLWQWIRAAR